VNNTSSTNDVRNRLQRIFEQTRQTSGAPYEPERLLAFLTEPPAPKGRRVADTFAGRRRFVRFIHAVQMDAGICFTLEEWERGLALDELATTVAAKMAKPEQALRLAKQRLEEARRRRVADPVKFGLLTFPLLVVAGLADSWAARIACALLWTGIVAGVAALSISEVRYTRELVSRIAARAGRGGVGGSQAEW
jgi:hypothetical protein